MHGAGGEQMGQVIEAGTPRLCRYSAKIPRASGRLFSVIIGLALGFTYLTLAASPAQARIAAAIVVDEETGRVVQAINPDLPHSPASLTKLMTAYLVFEAIEKGRLKLD